MPSVHHTAGAVPLHLRPGADPQRPRLLAAAARGSELRQADAGTATVHADAQAAGEARGSWSHSG